MPIKPGLTVYIDADPSSAGSHPLRASVYEVRGDRLILSQSSPPLPSSLVNRPVAVSFISKEGGLTRRLGFIGIVAGFVSDYTLSSRAHAPAVLLDRKKDLRSITMRRSSRVQPAGDAGLRLSIRDGAYPIFDISVHGINFILPPEENAFVPDEVVRLSLEIDGERFDLRAKVIRKFERQGIGHVAADFIDLDRGVEDILAIKLFSLEMQGMPPGAR